VLAASLAEPQPAAQLSLERRAGESGDLPVLIDRLAARLGPGAVRRPVLAASHWPERAVRFAAPLDPAKNAAPRPRPRPVRFLKEPEPVEAVAPVPDDPPLLFRWRKIMHRVRRADGPERIAGEWWLGVRELRDYYRVEDEEGRRFWLYRAGLYRADRPARWYLHGVFA
jgi:protein ImuB